MYVNKTIRNESKTCRKIKGGSYKISIILASNCHRVLNLEPNLCIYPKGLYANYLILMSMNINEKMRNYRKIGEKSRDVPRKFLIFHLVIALENQIWYQTDAKIPTFNLLIRYANYLII